uniref:Uncharacterized protein n=1 Tax=Leptocylindrus danicus TaxID=163516 RepID=A0A7S2JYS6_9STRA
MHELLLWLYLAEMVSFSQTTLNCFNYRTAGITHLFQWVIIVIIKGANLDFPRPRLQPNAKELLYLTIRTSEVISSTHNKPVKILKRQNRTTGYVMDKEECLQNALDTAMATTELEINTKSQE